MDNVFLANGNTETCIIKVSLATSTTNYYRNIFFWSWRLFVRLHRRNFFIFYFLNLGLTVNWMGRFYTNSNMCFGRLMSLLLRFLTCKLRDDCLSYIMTYILLCPLHIYHMIMVISLRIKVSYSFDVHCYNYCTIVLIWWFHCSQNKEFYVTK